MVKDMGASNTACPQVAPERSEATCILWDRGVGRCPVSRHLLPTPRMSHCARGRGRPNTSRCGDDLLVGKRGAHITEQGPRATRVPCFMARTSPPTRCCTPAEDVRKLVGRDAGSGRSKSWSPDGSRFRTVQLVPPDWAGRAVLLPPDLAAWRPLFSRLPFNVAAGRAGTPYRGRP